jgi:hypothetical protein
MFNFAIIVFVAGWALWFLIDKNPASLGVIVPGEFDSMLDNFQVAFDLLTAGFLRASFVFIWKAHYIVITVITALLISALHQSIFSVFHRRHLRQMIWPKKLSSDKHDKQKPE